MKNLKSNGRRFIISVLFGLASTLFCMQQGNATGPVKQIALNVGKIDALHHKTLVDSYLQKFVDSKKISYQVFTYLWNYPDRRKAKQIKRYIELVINTCGSIRKSKNITGNQLAGEFEEAISFMPANSGQYNYILTGDPEWLRAGSLCEIMVDTWNKKLCEITQEINKEWILANQATLSDTILVLQAQTDYKSAVSHNIQI